MGRCRCGFQPGKSSIDQAKSFLLSEQFRTEEELRELAQRIRAGQPLSFGEDEIKLAMTIGNWNAAVTGSFLIFAVSLGLLLGCTLAGMPAVAIATAGAAAAITGVIAFKLAAYVDRMVARRSLTLAGTDRP
jgi:hypothetical protein